MTKAEKEIILDLAMRYNFAARNANIKTNEECYRAMGRFAAMFSLMSKLHLLEEYETYVNNNKEKLEHWRKGGFCI